jgi:hypothetical protein
MHLVLFRCRPAMLQICCHARTGRARRAWPEADKTLVYVLTLYVDNWQKQLWFSDFFHVFDAAAALGVTCGYQNRAFCPQFG